MDESEILEDLERPFDFNSVILGHFFPDVEQQTQMLSQWCIEQTKHFNT